MTNAEFAILSLIAEGPQHGYGLEQLIEARGMREWAEVGFSSIYYVLKKLQKEGLVMDTVGPGERGLGRRVYHITPAGVDAWRRTCLEALAEPQLSFAAFMLGLGGLPALPPDQARAALERRIGHLAAREARMAAQQQAQQPLPEHVEALFDFSLTLAAAERRWVEAALARLEARDHD